MKTTWFKMAGICIASFAFVALGLGTAATAQEGPHRRGVTAQRPVRCRRTEC
jgi:hypothetical protein